MRRNLTAMALLAGLLAPAQALAGVAATLYKDPNCGCCSEHGRYLEGHGFEVTVVETPDLDAVKAKHRVPEAMQGCHTLLVGGYVVEGHVPVRAIEKLLAEKPAVRGISLPGMPTGSPGMGGPKTGPFVVQAFGDDGTKVFAVE